MTSWPCAGCWLPGCLVELAPRPPRANSCHCASLQVPLSPGGTLPPGQYQWGFAFQLPEGLPSSFEYREAKHTE